MDPLEYRYADRDIVGNRLYYRLKQTDFDGQFEYFNIVVVDILDVTDGFKVYPNPAYQDLLIQGHLQQQTIVTYSLLDLLGNELYQDSFFGTGEFERNIDVSMQTPGIYWLRFDIDGTVGIRKIVISGN